jgi:hypothetical protein
LSHHHNLRLWWFDALARIALADILLISVAATSAATTRFVAPVMTIFETKTRQTTAVVSAALHDLLERME